MARVKLDQEVNVGGGEITTCAKLLDDRRAIVEKVPNFMGRGGKTVTKYFVVLLDSNSQPTSACFEIGQYAYQSRYAKGQSRLPQKAAEGAALSIEGIPSQFIANGVLYRGQRSPVEGEGWLWQIDSVPYDVMVLMRKFFIIFHEQATETGGFLYSVSYSGREF